MKLLEKEQNVVATPVVVRPLERSITRPNVEVRARVVARPVRRRSPLPEIFGRATAFAGLIGAVYVVSTLCGYVALERARQGARQGAARAVFAQSEAKVARESINAMTNPSRLREWAAAHDFVAGETAEAVVARR